MNHSSDIRVLIVGATGMLGHKLWQSFGPRFDTWATIRRSVDNECGGLLRGDRVIPHVVAEDFGTVGAACATANPGVIVNCVGIIKQAKAAADPVPSIAINALFPHRLAALAREIGARLIHISTDCVFSGERGHYAERDVPDASDLYGRTKLLGEVTGPECLTIRTSIVGRELSATTGLTEWFLSQRGGRVPGFTEARFSGFTTVALARVLADVIARHRDLAGLYHVAAAPISKYDLLLKLNAAYGAGIAIEPTDAVRIDRTLDGSRFARATGIVAPGWDEMVAEMAADPTPYDEWRQSRV